MKKEPVSLTCDVFSYGMVLLELFTQDIPFAGVPNHQIGQKITSGEVPLCMKFHCSNVSGYYEGTYIPLHSFNS